MTTNYHTDIVTGAPANAATFNDPLGELDLALTHTNVEFVETDAIDTTVTTAHTWYYLSPAEVSFTPAYTGQTFTIHYHVGTLESDNAGVITAQVAITDGANADVYAQFLYGRGSVDGTYTSVSGSRVWSAAAEDVGETRKARIYLTHSTSATTVTAAYTNIQVSTH